MTLQPPSIRRLAGALTVASAALLAACGGGGGDTAGIGTGGTGSFGVGPVTGFGSIFVNGVRYDDDGARLVDDDGKVTVLGSGDNPLKVGMIVEVSGSVDDSGMRKATQIAYGAEIKGPVTAVDAAAGSFTVFGITVRTTTTTVYEDFGGVAGLAPGNVVEVHGQPDASGRVVATHVEREAATEAAYIADDGEYRVRGPVAGLIASSSAYTFSVRGVAIRTDGMTVVEGTPANGATVSVKLDPLAQPDGRYLAERLTVREASYAGLPSASEAEIEGYVSDFDATTGSLRVAGYAARLGSSVVYEDGVAADLKDGVRVEANGSIEDGVLVVTKVEFESRDDDDDGDDDEVPGGQMNFEFEGIAACSSCGASSGSFSIKGASVSYDASTRFEDGLSGATLDGKTVEVDCVAVVTDSGTTYRATRIELDD